MPLPADLPAGLEKIMRELNYDCGVPYNKGPLAFIISPLKFKEVKDQLNDFIGIGGYYLWYSIETGHHYTGSGKCIVKRLQNYFHSAPNNNAREFIISRGTSNFIIVVLGLYGPKL